MCGTTAPERRAAAPRGQPLPPISSYLFARHHHTYAHTYTATISDLKRNRLTLRIFLYPLSLAHTRVLLSRIAGISRRDIPSLLPPRTPSLICKFGDVDRDNSRYSKNRSSLVSRVGGGGREYIHVTPCMTGRINRCLF